MFNSNRRELIAFLFLFQLTEVTVAQTTEQATHIPVSEIMAAYQGARQDPRSAGACGRHWNDINVGVGILRRESTQTDEGEGITALSHRNITEIYYVLSGSGIL